MIKRAIFLKIGGVFCDLRFSHSNRRRRLYRRFHALLQTYWMEGWRGVGRRLFLLLLRLATMEFGWHLVLLFRRTQLLTQDFVFIRWKVIMPDSAFERARPRIGLLFTFDNPKRAAHRILDDIIEIWVINYLIEVFTPLLLVQFVKLLDLLLLQLEMLFLAFKFFKELRLWLQKLIVFDVPINTLTEVIAFHQVIMLILIHPKDEFGHISDIHRLDQRQRLLQYFLGYVDRLHLQLPRIEQTSCNRLMFTLVVTDFLQQVIETSLRETSWFLFYTAIRVIAQVAFVPLHRNEVLLGMRPDLSSTSGTDELLNSAPVFPKQTDGLQKQTVLFVSPSTFRSALTIPPHVWVHTLIDGVLF